MSGAFARWLNIMNNDYIGIETIAGQFVDLLNIKYLKMTKEKRLKNLSSLAKRIVEFRYDNVQNVWGRIYSEWFSNNGI